jgi:hypothetical protein
MVERETVGFDTGLMAFASWSLLFFVYGPSSVKALQIKGLRPVSFQDTGDRMWSKFPFFVLYMH